MFKALKILFLLILLAVLIFVSCGYTPPENLTKLVEMDGYTLYCPVWSPAGKIYFLATDRKLGSSSYFGGPLWVCDTSGENLRLLLDGLFGYLAISNDGSKLALTCGYLFNEGIDEGGVLIVVDSCGNILDTIPTSEPRVVTARFSYDGNKIYYCAFGGDSDGFYRANINGTNEEFLQGVGYSPFFDVTEGGRLIVDPIIGATCDVSPVDSNLVIGAETYTWAMGPSLILHNLTTREDSIIDVKPYKSTAASFPYWSTDGYKIVFTAAPKGGFEGWPGYGCLWILDLTKEE